MVGSIFIKCFTLLLNLLYTGAGREIHGLKVHGLFFASVFVFFTCGDIQISILRPQFKLRFHNDKSVSVQKEIENAE